jgi:hypothetical protein
MEAHMIGLKTCNTCENLICIKGINVSMMFVVLTSNCYVL